MKELTLRVYFISSNQTFSAFQELVMRVLRELKGLNTLFDRLYASTNHGEKIAEDFENLTPILLREVYDKEIKYENVDPVNGNLTANSTSPIGFMATFSNERRAKPDSLRIFIDSGNDRHVSQLIVDFPTSIDCLRDKEIARSYLATLGRCVGAYFGSIYTYQFWEKIHSDNYDLEIDWLNYFGNKKVFNYIPKDKVEKVEMASQGYTLLTLTNHIPSSDNADDVARAIAVRDALAPHGFLNLPT